MQEDNTCVLRHVQKGHALCGQRRPRSACSFVQSDQGLSCPLNGYQLATEEHVEERHSLDLISWVCRLILPSQFV